jgi:hypothetical protein
MRGQQPKTAAQAGDLRLRIRTALLGLEDKDLSGQAELGMQSLINGIQMPWERESVLRDTLSGLDQCTANARKLRYRYMASCLAYTEQQDYHAQ